jgi:hypothetical protein
MVTDTTTTLFNAILLIWAVGGGLYLVIGMIISPTIYPPHRRSQRETEDRRR